jgi:hypothetical protein
MVSADRVSRFSDRYAWFDCSAEFAGGFAGFGGNTSEQFGNGAFADVWIEPAIPFEDPPTMTGFTDSIDLTDDGTTVDVHATFPVFDPDGNELGDAALDAILVRSGDVLIFSPPSGKTNQKDRTAGSEDVLLGSGTLSIPATDVEADCVGGVGEVHAFTTNPRGFVSDNAGVQIDCFWETETQSAFMFGINDGFGFFVDTGLNSGDLELSGTGFINGSLSLDGAGMNVDFDLMDGPTGDPYTASAVASFTPLGSPVNSTYLSETAQSRSTEQALDPAGTLDFSTGDSFPIDDEHCNALTFSNHTTANRPQGPTSGPPPVNDTPDGAIALHVGSHLNASNVAAAADPEIQLQNCPEGFFDQFGRTLWYTIEGTGSLVTIDTAGSNFDTLIAVYVATDTGYEEIGCIDDVEFEPIGATFQAALTFDTGEGVTYYAQIGGYDFPFDEEVNAQKGRLRITVR